MADTEPSPGGRPARLARFLQAWRHAGIRVSLTGGHAVDLMSGVTGPHKDVDLLFPLEDLPAVTAWLTAHHLARPRGAAGGMVVTPLGYTDLLTVVLGPDGRWRPSWRTDGIPWPLGHPLDHVLAIGGYSLPILSAGDMWLRILADFGPGSQRARTEGRRLERLMSPEERAETLGFFTREQEARGRTPGSHPA